MPIAPARGAQGRAGTTLLELLAVLLVLGILTALVIGVGRRAVESSRIARAQAELAVLAGALEAYKRLLGDYPRTDDAAVLLESLLGWRDPAGAALEFRAVLEVGAFTLSAPADSGVGPGARMVDPWGQPYRYAYRVPAAGWLNSGFVLYSAGPDGRASVALLPGGFVDATAPGNADNLHANR